MRKRIGLVIHNMHEEYSIELIKGAERFCKEQNFQLIIFPINAKYSEQHGFEYRNRSIIKLINNNNIDGVIFSASSLCAFEKKVELKDELNKIKNLPSVCIGMNIPGYSYVDSDSKSSFQKMILHLIKKHNKRKFLIFCSYDSNADSKKRKDWCLEIFKKENIEIPKSKIINAEYNRFRATEHIVDYVNKNGVDFDAIICFNDTMAFGVIKGLYDLNLKVPDDIVVTGFDNTKKALFSIPPLTSIDQQISEQTYQAGHILLKQFKNPSYIGSKIVKSSEKFRRSCGCLQENDLMTNYINDSGYEKKFAEEELYKIIHSDHISTNNELYILHHLIQSSLTVFTLDELFELLPKYIKTATLDGLAFFIYDKPKPFKSSKNDFNVPHLIKRIFSYEPNIDKEPNLKVEHFNPYFDAFPESTFNKEYDKVVIIPIFESAFQYGYLIAPLGNRDYLFYQTMFEVFCKELTTAINLTNFQNENFKLESKNIKLKKHSSKLDTLSTTDELTSINNRRGFMTQASKMIKKSISKNKSGLIIFCDMDGLKKINDTFGHKAGDRAILAETSILQKVIRSSDVLGRIGGDEFAIAAEGASMEFFNTFIRRIEEESQKFNSINKEKFKISISAGAAIFSSDETNLESLLSKADKELYKEKQKKKRILN